MIQSCIGVPPGLPDLPWTSWPVNPWNNEDGVGEYAAGWTYGDFDGDGLLDGVSSDPTADDLRGYVHVVFGDGRETTLRRGQGGLAGAYEQYDLFGAAITVGDFDADGFDDLAVSAPGSSVSGRTYAGGVHIIYGNSSGLSTTGDQLFTQDSTGIQGVAEDADFFGEALAVGDFDGDGYADLAVGTPQEDIGSIGNAGYVGVIYGSAGGLSTVDDGWHQDVSGVYGAAESEDNFGSEVLAMDITGDGISELVVTASGEGIGSQDNRGIIQVLNGTTSGVSAVGDYHLRPSDFGISGTDPHLGMIAKQLDFDADSLADKLVFHAKGDVTGSNCGWYDDDSKTTVFVAVPAGGVLTPECPS